jgi:hypothetical protein
MTSKATNRREGGDSELLSAPTIGGGECPGRGCWWWESNESILVYVLHVFNIINSF